MDKTIKYICVLDISLMSLGQAISNALGQEYFVISVPEVKKNVIEFYAVPPLN